MARTRRTHNALLVKALVTRIEALASGEALNYDEIKEIIGIDPQDEGRVVVASARKIALKERGVSLLTKNGVGFMRTPAEGFGVIANKTKLGLHRKAKEGYDHMSSISTEELSSLSPGEQNRIALHQVMFGRIATFTNERRFSAKAKPLGNQTIGQDVAVSVISEMFSESKVKRDKKKLG